MLTIRTEKESIHAARSTLSDVLHRKKEDKTIKQNSSKEKVLLVYHENYKLLNKTPDYYNPRHHLLPLVLLSIVYHKMNRLTPGSTPGFTIKLSCGRGDKDF